MRLEHRYFLTEDRSKLVREDDLEANTLIYPPGTEIGEEEAAKWGLIKPPANKAVKPTSKEGK